MAGAGPECYLGFSILLAQPPENIPPSPLLATFFAFVPTAKTLSSPRVFAITSCLLSVFVIACLSFYLSGRNGYHKT
jgi:hypothetical protein